MPVWRLLNPDLMKTALLAGSTGLIGSQLLTLLLDSNRYSRVIALTRHELPAHPKLTQIHADGQTLIAYVDQLGADDVFCCLGTTMAKAGSKEKFHQVDFTYPVELATLALARGATQFLVVSSLGADKSSAIYYNQVKGELEEALMGMGYQTLHILRPSLLLGPRKESRTGEDSAKIVYKIFGFLIPKKYKAIDSAKVARGLLHFAGREQTGTFIHESNELQSF